MAEGFLRTANDGTYLTLKVSPGANSTGIRGLYGEAALRLSVSAPPIAGKANEEVERFLTSLLGVRKGGVCVIGGASSRDKLVFVRGRVPDEVEARLAPFL